MHIKIFLKKFISIVVTVILSVTMVGCFDLGDFEDESEYYNAFGDVQLVYQNPNAVEKDVMYEEYSVKDYFYNSNTGNDFVYGDPNDDDPDEGKDIPRLPYVYMAIPFKQDLNVDSVALYFNALEKCSLKVSFYIVDKLPDGGDFDNIRIFGEPEFRPKLDDDDNPLYDDNNNPILEKIEYSDPHESLIVYNATISLTKDKWTSVVVDTWSKGDVVEVKDSQYLLLRFVNNSGASEEGDIPVAFRVTNLLIRAV